MSNETDPSKRIPKSLDTDPQLVGTYSLTDLAVAGLPGVVIVLVTQVVLPSSLRINGVSVTALTLPLALVATGVGALFVYLTPAYMTSLDGLGLFANFHLTNSRVPSEEVKESPQIERIWPEHDAIERQDGTMVGAVQVEPPTMALATDEEWTDKAEAFQDFANTFVEFPIQIYSTTQPFPTEAYVARYRRRLADSDVLFNEKLAGLIEHYVDWYEQEVAQRQMTIRDHYVLIPVKPEEVRYGRGSLTRKLADLPFLGILVMAVTAPPIDRERDALFEALDGRRRHIERGLRTIEGCDAWSVDGEELTRVVGDFWASYDLEQSTVSKALQRASTTDSNQ